MSTLELMEPVILLVVAIAALSASVARRRGKKPPTIALVFALHCFGITAVGLGILALMFHGYVEDSGLEPSNTLPMAIPLLVLGAAMVIAGGRLTRQKRKPPSAYRCPMCRTYFDELEDLRAHRRTCGDL
jgi:hypothetical protein